MFLHDILIETKGNSEKRSANTYIIFKKLDNEGLAFNLQNCEFANETMDSLGFNTTPDEGTSLVTKTESPPKLDPLIH